MDNLTTEELTKLIYEKLESLSYEIVLSNPTTKSKFPTIVIQTPLEGVSLQYGNQVVKKRFQVSIECWADKKYETMKMSEEISQILTQYNFIRNNTMPDIFDDITKKYRFISTYEIKYNELTHSFM